MANSNQLELVVTVEVDKANQSIKSINTNLTGMEASASKTTATATAGINGMERAMAKGALAGNLLAEAFHKVLEFAKEWTVEAVKLAAHEERLTHAGEGLAKAHGVAAEAFHKSVEEVKALGIHGEDALGMINKLIVADVGIEKAKGLAELAKNLGAIGNMSTAEAMEGIVRAIDTGQARALKATGLIVNFTKEQQAMEYKLGRTLTDNEVIQMRYQAIMKAGAAVQGAYAATAGDAESKSRRLSVEIEELKEALGGQFQAEYKKILDYSREMVKWLGENTDMLVKFAEGAGIAAGLLATYAIATKILEIATAVKALSLALIANPWALLLTGIVAGGAVVYYEYNKMMDQMHERGEKMLNDAKRQQLVSGKIKIEDLRKEGMSDDAIRELITGKKLEPGEQPFNWGGPKITIGKPKAESDYAYLTEVRKQQNEGLRSSNEILQRSVEELKGAEATQAKARIQDNLKIVESTSSVTEASRASLNVVMEIQNQFKAARDKVAEEEKREITKASSFMYNGQLKTRALSSSELDNIHGATANKLKALELAENEEVAKITEQMWKASAERSRKIFEQLYIEPLKKQLYIWDQTAQLDDQRKGQGLDIQLQGADQRKQLALAQLDTINAVTIQDKIAVEKMKTAIEVTAIKERTAIELQQIDLRTEHQIAEARKSAMAQGIFDDESIKTITDRIQVITDEEKAALSKNSNSQIQVEAVKGAVAVKNTTQQYYQSIFQSLKQQAGGVFDALVTKSESVWKAIGNSLKTAILTAIKDVVTSRIATALMNMFVPGAGASMKQRGGMGKQAGGGLLGLLGLGAVPSFGAGGGATGGTPPFLPSPAGGGQGSWGGSGVSLDQLYNLPLSHSNPASVVGPGGTATFADMPSSAANSGTAGSPLGQLSKLFSKGSGQSRMEALQGLAVMAGLGMVTSGMQKGNAGMTVAGGAAMGYGMAGQMGMTGYGGAITGAGAGLFLDGMRRGGKLGVAESAGGGAVVGMQFGGPLGAAIGAGAGFLAGVVRLFIKGAAEKAHDKIKQIYGVDISDKKFLKQIVDMTNQTYGGNLDVAIRSKDIRDMILLYAQSTGQSTKGMPAQMSSLSLVQTGGSLYQAPSYQNGTQLSGLGGLPSVDSISAGSSSGAGSPTIVVPLNIDGNTVGTAVIQNGRVVAQGAISAMKSNAGRRELTALQLSPGLVTS